jgi:pteridine reductase
MTSAAPVALITGVGKRRVGWHIADALLARGYRLALQYRTSSEDADALVAAAEAKKLDATAIRADVTDEASMHAMVDSTLELFGQIDVLVNAAAIWQRKRLEDVTAEDVRLHFETNALGTFLVSQRAGLAMVRQASGGAIINIGDWADARPYLDYAAYFPSKGAVATITRTLAVELGTRNPKIRVNCILPGPVMLPSDLPAEERKQAIDATLVKHEGSPSNVVLAVLHFSDNDFVTGACLPVDGGRTVYAPD